MATKKESGGVKESYELQNLLRQVEELWESFHRVDDSGLADSEDLSRISDVLEKIIEKIKQVRISGDDDGSKKQDDGSKKQDDDHEKLFPPSKREELAELVPLLRTALQQRMQPAGAERPADKHLPSSSVVAVAAAATGCYPCKPRRPSSQQQQEEADKGGAAAPAPAAVLSLKLLHRLAQNVLEPEQYYEWTTSYVDEERLYGWDKEAGDVVDSLIAAPKAKAKDDDDQEDPDPMFRAAGIAGIHGSGKTALAQKVFVHDKAKDNFAIRLWVCVGPPDSEDRFNLLYRMLDNLGLDTAKVEDDIVTKSNVVRQAAEKEAEKMKKKGGDEVEELRKKAKEEMAKKKNDAQQPQAAVDDGAKEEEDRILDQLLRESKAVQDSYEVQRSKIGVLLYILHVTLSKTSYLIVFDDIRVYRHPDHDRDRDDHWYSNLTLLPPPEGEWGDRLAYGLPKCTNHKGAVLVTCRKEDDAKAMVRTGRVFHPPKLEGKDAWDLFTREYKQAKKDAAAAAAADNDNKQQQQQPPPPPDKKEDDDDDVLLKDLGQIKEQIINKCLGLPVAIIEAARGFALLDPLPTTNVLPAGDHNDEDYALKEAAAAAAAGNKPEDHQTNKDREEEVDDE